PKLMEATMAWHQLSQGTFDVIKRWAGFNEIVPSNEKYHGHNRWDSASYEHSTFFSYRTPIAKYHRNEKGELYVLITSADYSLTTVKHKRWLSSAVKVPEFTVPFIGTNNGDVTVDNMHRENMDYLRIHIYELMDKAIKRFQYDDLHSWDFLIESQYRSMENYSRLSGEPMIMEHTFDELMKIVSNARQVKLARWSDPKAAARRE